MIEVIIIGILLCVSVILTAFKGRNSSCDFDTGVIMGGGMAILMTIEVYLLADIIGKPKPSALDVYQGKISNNGNSYCYLTLFGNICVETRLYRKSPCFRVYKNVL